MRTAKPRILIVEDEYLIAMEIGDAVAACGGSVVGPVGTLSGARQLAGTAMLEGAVLDLRLGRDWVWPVADLLYERSVPFVLLTGYDSPEIPRHLRSARFILKPVTEEALGQALREILATVRGPAPWGLFRMAI